MLYYYYALSSLVEFVGSIPLRPSIFCLVFRGQGDSPVPIKPVNQGLQVRLCSWKGDMTMHHQRGNWQDEESLIAVRQGQVQDTGILDFGSRYQV